MRERLPRFGKEVPLAAVFLLAAFVAAVFANNIGELYLWALPVPLAAAAVLGWGWGAVCRIIFKNKHKATVFCAAAAVLFVSYGGAQELVGAVSGLLPWLGRWHVAEGVVVFFLWAAAAAAIFLVVRRTKRDLAGAGRFLTIAAAAALIIPTGRIIQYEAVKRIEGGSASPLVLPEARADVAGRKLPDIYYIVPEDYSSPAVMKDYFNSDNSDFTAFLEKEGFYVPEKPSSNYPKSFLSVASALNMEYLDYLGSHRNSSDQTIVNPLIDDNNVMRFLAEYGYSYYQMGSWWEPTKYNPLATDNYTLERQNRLGMSEFTYALVAATMVRPVFDRIYPAVALGQSDGDQRRRILYQFATLPEVARLPGRKMVFVHIIAPHGPYVFGKDCEFVRSKDIAAIPEEVNYANQAACIDKKLEAAVGQIMDISKKTAVIMIQSDEGAPFLGGRLSPADNWKTADDALLKEKFPILAAYYLPGVSKKAFYPTMTPVNGFRVVLNQYFSAGLALLPDRNYIFADIKHLYEFTDVTKRVTQP